MMKKKQAKSKGKKGVNLMNMVDNIEPNMFDKSHQNMTKLRVDDYGSMAPTQPQQQDDIIQADFANEISRLIISDGGNSVKSISNVSSVSSSSNVQPIKHASLPAKIPLAPKQEISKEPKLRTARTLSRKELFDDFGAKDYYDLSKIPDLKTKIKESPNDPCHLKFYGVEQLTDAVFYLLACDKTSYDNVKLVDLTGCHRITDQGVMWMADAFPSLTQVYLVGLYQVTEASLLYLLNKCSKLKNIAIKGTSVTILPRKIGSQSLEIDFEGYPCISPELDILQKSRGAIMQAPAYSKPDNEDIVKMVVIQTQTAGKKQSLVQHLKGEKTMDSQPLFAVNNLAFGSRFKVNAIECDEVLSHLFITKRTLLVFPVYSHTKTKDAVKTIFGYVSYISSKVTGAVFIIAGMDGMQSQAETIAKDVKALADKTASFYKRKVEGDTKMILKGDQGKNIDDQEIFTRTLVSNMRLQDVHIDFVNMDLSKPFSASSDSGKKFETALQKVVEACPEVQELADPMFKYISSGGLEKMMGDGAASMESLKSSRVAVLDLMAMMGRIMVQRIIQDTDLSCSIPWLSKLVNIALVPPEGSKTSSDNMTNLKDETPYWEINELKTTLLKAGLNNVDNGILLLSKLGIGISGSGFTSFSHIDSEPFVELDQFFPEFPDFTKKKDVFYTSGFQIEFNTPVPCFIMQRLVNICCIIRKPAVIWEKGIILQEACVETMFHLQDHEKADGSTLSLLSHTVKNNKTSVTEQDIVQIVWNTLNTYKAVLKFILKESGLPYTRKTIGQKATTKEGIVELVSNHLFKVPEDSAQPMVLCTKCGSNPKATSLPWTLHSSLMSSIFKVSMLEVIKEDEQTDEDVEKLSKARFNGSVIHLQANEQAIITSGIRSGNQTGFKLLITEASGNKIMIGMGFQYSKKTRKFIKTIYLDLAKGTMTMKQHNVSPPNVVGNCNPGSIPSVGDTVSFELKTNQENPKFSELEICRNSEKIGGFGVPDNVFLPFVQSYGDKVKFMIYPLYDYVEVANEIKVGMRLEALDRLNPSLICVATIADVYPDGKILIHFDGWTNRYDYVSEPDSNDLHPVGWFKQNGQKDRGLRGQLQAPHGYHRHDFDWYRYCVEEIQQPPVPYNWFTPAQIKGTPSDELDGIIANFNLGKGDSSFAMPCVSLNNRPKVYEYSILKKCVMSPELFSFFTNHNKFFCLLPKGLDHKTLRNPSLQALMDFSRQNVHVLCPGLKMELLHFVDSPGTNFIEDKSIEELAVYLQYCYQGILLQNETLPLHCVELISGFNKIKGKEANSMMLKICFLYLNILEFLSHRNKNKEVKSPRVAIEIFNRAVKTKEYGNGVLSGTDTNIKCRGHSMSMMTNKDLQEISMDDFKQTYSFMTRLEFSDNHLEKLPDDFFQNFVALEILSVSNNKLTALPSGIDNLKDLEHLDISKNKMQALPTELGDLHETLTYLDISDNPFNELPKVINKLVNLEDLLAENIGVIKDLSGVTNLKKLVTLNVGKNKIAEFPAGLHELPLTSLDMSGVPWVPLSTFQSYQAFTHTLNMNNVTGAMTEEEKTSLFKAADADLSSNLTPDEVLSMNFNILFPSYPRFGEGSLNYPNSGGIPSMILEMKQLKRLILCYHGIQSIPDDIKNLKELTELDLSFNPKLVSLSAELGGLGLKQLHLKDCIVLNTPPKEIVARGFLAVMGYLKRLRLGASPCKRTKLMMVGLGGAGKTSLVQSLMNRKYRAYMDADEPITDGIDIKTWEVPIEGDKDKLTYSVWDFAGQTVYYNTHQFFLSNRAVYLLLWNVRQGYEHAGLDFWLSSIACHAPKAPILVIGTHIDKVEKYKLPEDVLKTRYPQISGFHYVSAYTGDGVESLKTVIIQKTLEQKYMGEKIPEAWLTLEKKLIKYREEKKVDLLPLKNLADIGSTCGIFDNLELVQAIQFLHDLGAVQFFNKDFLRDMVVIYPQWIIDLVQAIQFLHDLGAVQFFNKDFLRDMVVIYPQWIIDLVQAIQFLHDLGAVQFFNKDFLRDMMVIYPQWIIDLVQAIQFLHDLGAVQFFNKDFLRDMVVIYPQWIIDVMACLVTVHEGAVKDGKLQLKDVSKVWADYPKELHPWLLRLTEEFDLTCPLGDEEASIVPCLLPDEEPDFNWPHANPEKNIRESIIIYKFQYLPAGLFNRAQVRLNQYSKGALIWKRGSFMKKNNHIALMLQTGDQEVIVRSQGFRPENFLFIVHEMIETLIMESYSGVNYDFMVPCLDCLNMNVKDPSMVGNNRVQRAMEMNVPFIQCDKFFHILSIQEVKDSMPSDKMSDMDSHLRNSVRELIDLTQETTVSVFFIYTTKNVPELKDVETTVSPGQIMEDLRKHGSFKVSYSDKPETSNMEALTLAVKSTDVVMIGMSDEFCDNAECKKLLLYIKDVLRLPVLLVLLGTSKRWQKGELNMSFGSEVYVDMQNIKRYEHKVNELYDAIKKKASSNKKVAAENTTKCFISYCWSNSHDAIEKGSRNVEGALGPWKGSDPREVKTFLDSKNIKCWIDVEKVGGTGLFTSIADGLREAEVMVAFVSNEYVNSKNCVMEFRYALTTLRIPVILVVVGTGYEWERSEIGLLAVGHKCPKINLQYHNETGYLEILSLVQERLKNTEHEAEAASSDNQRNVAFQEVLELTQRKFLRHITTSIISNDLQPYPCLFVVDFISDKEKEEWQKSDAERQKRARPQTARTHRDDKVEDEQNAKEKESGNEELAEPIIEGKAYHSQYCFRLMCENPQGWHVIPGVIPFPELEGTDEQQLIESAAPYLSRLLAIAKHSNIALQCLTTPDGQIFQQRIEEIGVKSASDFKEEYLQLRETVMQEDKHKVFSHLARCQVNGKMVWLCDDHKKASRSKTEERYNIDIPLPKDDLPEDYVPPEMEPERKPIEKAEKKVPKIFNRRAESKGNKPLQRQTSQACSCM